MDVKIGQGESDALARLRREAEIEMRRVLDDSRPLKRPRCPSGDDATTLVPIDRFRYSVVQDLEAGAKAFLITCNFRREKSATREVSHLLRRYMPQHLFPQPQPPPPPPPAAQEPGSETAPAPARDGDGDDKVKGEQQEQQQLLPTPAGGLLDLRPGPQVAAPGRDLRRAARPAALRQSGGAGRRGQPGGGAELAGGSRSKSGSNSDEDEDVDEEGDDKEKGEERGHTAATAAATAAAAAAGARGGEGVSEGSAGDEGTGGEPSALGLAKVGCRGVVLVRLSSAAAAAVEPVELVAAVLSDLGTRALPPPRHCQRIIPLDATCLITAPGLATAVAAAAAAFKRRQGGNAGGDSAAGVQPFSYAIVYRSRVTEVPAAAAAAAVDDVTAAATTGGGSAEGEAAAVLTDRGRIISLVAEAMSAAFGDAALVDLKRPQVAVLVEVVPVAGRQFAGVVLLPGHMFVAKGKLVVKPLARNALPT